jgi:spore coat polysaccharide biosynthesis predicted glycosyltransferase SpsG
MNREPILFRVDGATRSWEHLWRCLTFAAALQRRRRPAYFLSHLEPGSLGLVVKRAGNEWLDAGAEPGSDDDAQETVEEIRRLGAAAVLVDMPQATEDYLRQLAATGTMVISLDSQAGLRFPSRLLINPLLGPGREAYEYEPGSQLLLGRRYALVRPEVRRVRPLRSQEPPQPFRGVVALGDDDPNNQTAELAKLLLNTPKVGRVDMLVRSHHPDLAALQALAESCPERLAVATEPAEIQNRLARCHFALTAGNGWSLEMACLGVPQLIVVQSEVHWPTAQRLEDEGGAVCLGWHATASAGTIRQAVMDLLDDPLERQGMARIGRKLIDGRGPDRLVTALEILLHPSRRIQLGEAA